MIFGTNYKAGDVVLVGIASLENNQVKKRPVFVLYNKGNNIIAAALSRNKNMKGISLSKKDGATINCQLSLQYIFTFSQNAVIKKLFTVNLSRRKEIYRKIKKKLKEIL